MSVLLENTPIVKFLQTLFHTQTYEMTYSVGGIISMNIIQVIKRNLHDGLEIIPVYDFYVLVL